jgi:hypothetical protein
MRGVKVGEEGVETRRPGLLNGRPRKTNRPGRRSTVQTSWSEIAALSGFTGTSSAERTWGDRLGEGRTLAWFDRSPTKVAETVVIENPGLTVA